ncbi:MULTISPECIES: septum formation initiator family protein [unclassified Streptomyces]|uniref:FtsB family cell division protein n=1 Tax=Streptomycetaceae TaxID=2062 RepID=UPI002E796FA7|nr:MULTISPECIES: septum formation initiator family protein [unclassified Streptomyces]MED7948054.1 septum formation initiator family protein [Streptomyces sp. BE303]MEE1824171.1 septum formation initiator family protein [Streptomyces sp. BE20]
MAARPRFTSRATVLVLVLCSLVAILAYPTRQFISQRSEISSQRAKAEHARQQVEQLRREKARWQDPEYVKVQARARLHYAMPGETPYIAVDPAAGEATRSSVGAPPPAQGPATGPAKAARPWYAGIWDSVDAAAAPAAAPAAASAPPSPPAPAPAGDSSSHDH